MIVSCLRSIALGHVDQTCQPCCFAGLHACLCTSTAALWWRPRWGVRVLMLVGIAWDSS